MTKWEKRGIFNPRFFRWLWSSVTGSNPGADKTEKFLKTIDLRWKVLEFFCCKSNKTFALLLRDTLRNVSSLLQHFSFFKMSTSVTLWSSRIEPSFYPIWTCSFSVFRFESLKREKLMRRDSFLRLLRKFHEFKLIHEFCSTDISFYLHFLLLEQHCCRTKKCKNFNVVVGVNANLLSHPLLTQGLHYYCNKSENILELSFVKHVWVFFSFLLSSNTKFRAQVSFRNFALLRSSFSA